MNSSIGESGDSEHWEAALKRIEDKFDWFKLAKISLLSRHIDDLAENELAPQGLINYQFSAKGHELGQALMSQLMGRPGDAASVYYRSRPFMLGVGLTVEEAFSGDMARSAGVSQGRDVGVTYNLPNRGKCTVLPMAGDVGSGYTPAAGWAQALVYRREELGEEELGDSMVVAFGGEGSVASNGFWSAITMATTLRLPILFVIEDNGFAISVGRDLQTPGGNIARNLAAFTDLHVWSGSGTDPKETAGLVLESVNHVRQGKGPALLRLEVARLSGHSSMDNQAYKSEETLREEAARDPLPILREYLVPNVMDEMSWEVLEQDVKTEVSDAAQAAQDKMEADPGSVKQYAFFEFGQIQEVGGMAAEGITLPAGIQAPKAAGRRRINMVEAIRKTLDVELAGNNRCLVFGEDVALKGGVHTATMGLAAKHGPNRVFDTSLSEEGIIGRAVGMALAGLLPVPEIQFRKYADPATEQLNNCGTIRWRTANRFAAPIVVRVAGGFGRKIGDPWHSVTGEVFFAHAVGWQVAFPSNAEDAVGLLRSALRGNNPVLFFEHRAQLDAAWSRRPYPGDEYALPFGRANIIEEGDEVTVVTWGAMVERCQAAASQIQAGIEIIDLRTIVPWDQESVLDSVRKTSKCLIVHEDVAFAGFGAEISATIVEQAFLDLDGPVRRLAAPSVPVPFSHRLMEAVVPTTELIRQNILDLLAY